MNNGHIVLGAFVAVVGALLAFAIVLSRLVGAAVAPIFVASGYTVIVCLIVLAIRWALTQQMSVTIGIAVLCMAVSFPFWWPVLNNIAIGGGYHSAAMTERMLSAPWNQSWINSGWLKWGVEATLIVLAGTVGYREYND